MLSILIIDDSPFCRRMIRDLCSKIERCKVLAEAQNGQEGLEYIQKYHPDLIILDIHMPKLSGIELLEKLILMPFQPKVIFFSSSSKHEVHLAAQALALGALEIIEKPQGLSLHSQDQWKHDLRRSIGYLTQSLSGTARPSSALVNQKEKTIIALGGSTGGVQAIKYLLEHLPKKLRQSIIIALHMQRSFEESIAQILHNYSAHPLKLVQHDMQVEKSHIYLLSAQKQSQVIKKNQELHVLTKDLYRDIPCQPSIDDLFFNLSKLYGSEAVGIVLTGMGNDGAKGLQAMKAKGSYTIAQDEQSSMVFGIPQKAIEMNASCSISSLEEISTYIKKINA